jgi:hypothetical protein
LTRRSRLWFTQFNVMHGSSAKANFYLVPRIAVSLPAIRISGPNARAGNGA